MSCHDIGRGMNSVVRTTVTLMDEGKISKEAAKTIISCCAKSVNWCDGNEGEAIDYISKCMCGRCMKIVPEGGKLYSVYDVSRDFPDYYHLDDYLATNGLCEECFDIYLEERSGDKTAGEKQRKYIEEHCRPEDYTSTGEYEDNNNGYPWVNYTLA